MTELVMDDPFGFHKSLEEGVFKLEGVGKLYGEDETSYLDGKEFQFELVVRLKGNIGGRIVLSPVDPSSNIDDIENEINQIRSTKQDGISAFTWKLVGELKGEPIVVKTIYISSEEKSYLPSPNYKLICGFFEFEWGEDKGKYESCLTWVPNVEFGGCAGTTYQEGNISKSRLDHCQLSYPSLLGGLEVEMRQLRNYKKILNHLMLNGGSAVTSICNFESSSLASIKDFLEIIKRFFRLVSFASGKSILPLAYHFKGETEILILKPLNRVSYTKTLTWCDYDDTPHFLAEALQELLPNYFSLDEKLRDLFELAFYFYINLKTISHFSIDISLLATIYESYTCSDYFLPSGLRKDKNLKDKIRELFSYHNMSCNEELLKVFIDLRNAIAHSPHKLVNLLNSDARRSIRYMLRQVEILTLKRLKYTGRFRDTWEVVTDPSKSYPVYKFDTILERLKKEKEAAESN